MAKLLAVFLSIALFLIAVFGYPVLIQIYKNAFFTETIEPKTIDWSLVSFGNEDWRPKAIFSYKVRGKLYSQEEVFQGEKFRNPYKGEELLQELAKEKRLVWYNPNDPEQATIEKYFPKKRAIYTGILLGLLVYFIWGGRLYTSYWLSHHKKR